MRFKLRDNSILKQSSVFKIINEYKECSLRRLVQTDSLKTVYRSLIRSLETETDKTARLAIAFVYLY